MGQKVHQPPRFELHIADEPDAETQKCHLEPCTPPAGNGEKSSQGRVERDKDVPECRVLDAEPPEDGLVVVWQLSPEVAGEGRGEAGCQVGLDADKVEAGEDDGEIVAEILGGRHDGWMVGAGVMGME